MSNIGSTTSSPAASPMPTASDRGGVPVDPGAMAPSLPEPLQPRSRDQIHKGLDAAREQVSRDAKAKDAERAKRARARADEAGKDKVDDATRTGRTRQEINAAIAKAHAGVHGEPLGETAGTRTAPEGQTGSEHKIAPGRFSEEAKAAWGEVSEPVQREVHRMHRELERGLNLYRRDAEKWHELEPYRRVAEQSGLSLPKLAGHYKNLETSLLGRQGPERRVSAIRHLIQLANISPDELNSIYNEEPSARAAREAAEKSDRVERQLHQLTRFVTSGAPQRQAKVQGVVAAVTGFAASAEGFDDLADAIAADLRSGADAGLDPLTRLKNAYARARKGRGSRQAGSKSIAGAPASGSDPRLPSRKKSSSTSTAPGDRREEIASSVKRAAARMGMR